MMPPQNHSSRPAVALVTAHGWVGVSTPVLMTAKFLAERGYRVALYLEEDAACDQMGINIPRFETPDIQLHVHRRTAHAVGRTVRYQEMDISAPDMDFALRFKQPPETYEFIVGFDPEGLIRAGLLSSFWQIPLIYHSLELTDETAAGKTLERLFSQRALLTLIQDDARAQIISRINGIPRDNICIVPNNSIGDVLPEKRNHFHTRFNIPADRKVVLATGTLLPITCIDTIIQSTPLWPDPYVLVLHGWIPDRKFEAFVRSSIKAANRKIFLSTEVVDHDQKFTLFQSADFGLAFYAPEDINLEYAAGSSGKAFDFMRSGVPIIGNAIPGMKDLIEGNGCGRVVGSAREIGPSLTVIQKEYEHYRRNCLKAFYKYSFTAGYEAVLARLNTQKNPTILKEFQSAINSTDADSVRLTEEDISRAIAAYRATITEMKSGESKASASWSKFMNALEQDIRSLNEKSSIGSGGCHAASTAANTVDLLRLIRAIASTACDCHDFKLCLHLTSMGKALRYPFENLDYLRALAFKGVGQIGSAQEALKEELRFFPGNTAAQKFIEKIIPSEISSSKEVSEIDAFLNDIRPYTMLGEKRLRSLYERTLEICARDLPGNVVECGVAAGGSAALIAAVVKRHSARDRKMFCFDTFEGMPAPTAFDTHSGIQADDTGWGSGTCAAPVESLLAVCAKLNAADMVTPVKGLFKDTLPAMRDRIGSIAFLHMDGDWYESTKDILTHLFDRVVPGGIIQVDDYGHWQGCRKALHEFFEERGLKPKLNPIDGTGVWFLKNDGQLPLQEQSGKTRYINLGCGMHIHPAWVNVDFNATRPSVIAHDLNRGIPFEDASFDAAYHSHLLEHFPRSGASRFLGECFRILKPGARIRVVVPDLEQIARLYLGSLDGALAGDEEAQQRYEWMILELLDQMVRNVPGGEMLRYWKMDPMPAEDFVIQRAGAEVLNVRRHLLSQTKIKMPAKTNNDQPDARQIGAFRLSGENHQWMYDRYSLARMLLATGFQDIRVCRADESAIPGFNDFFLDIMPDGSVRKPDSLFMEALKP